MTPNLSFYTSRSPNQVVMSQCRGPRPRRRVLRIHRELPTAGSIFSFLPIYLVGSPNFSRPYLIDLAFGDKTPSPVISECHVPAGNVRSSSAFSILPYFGGSHVPSLQRLHTRAGATSPRSIYRLVESCTKKGDWRLLLPISRMEPRK